VCGCESNKPTEAVIQAGPKQPEPCDVALPRFPSILNVALRWHREY
jgi:hypothetical protein